MESCDAHFPTRRLLSYGYELYFSADIWQFTRGHGRIFPHVPPVLCSRVSSPPQFISSDLKFFSIGANIFSSVCQYEGSASVGASTSINGLLTGLLAMIIVNWSAFEGNQMLEQVRCCLLVFICLCIALNLMAGVKIDNNGTRSVDTVGHIGGAIVGLIWGLAFLPRAPGPTGQKCRMFGMAATAVFFILFTGLLFGLHHGKNQNTAGDLS